MVNGERVDELNIGWPGCVEEFPASLRFFSLIFPENPPIFPVFPPFSPLIFGRIGVFSSITRFLYF
jgi:hypothetical protein